MEGGGGGRGQGQGDGRSLGAEELPISQLPLLNKGISEEAAYVHHCGSLSLTVLLHLSINFSTSLTVFIYFALCLFTQFLFSSFRLCLPFTVSRGFPAFDAPCCDFYPFYQLASAFLLRVGKEQERAREHEAPCIIHL